MATYYSPIAGTLKGKILRDPIHQDIFVTNEELKLIDTKAFQRLRGIKQLGTSVYIYPGATHTRFEHSIGTLYVANKIIELVYNNSNTSEQYKNLIKDNYLLIRMGALLHDISHLPFGHSLEDESHLLSRHDELNPSSSSNTDSLFHSTRTEILSRVVYEELGGDPFFFNTVDEFHSFHNISQALRTM